MDKTLHYLYDPLCGWCYGAMPAMNTLLGVPGLRIELLPTGLFSGAGARPMDDEFAAFAWANDQTIEHSTGQPFSAAYRQCVLADRQTRFDSGPATLTLTAVASTAPTREYEVLKAIQHARYIDGRDITSPTVLAELLQALNLDEAAGLIKRPSADLLDINHARIIHARAWMNEFGARGVPTLIIQAGSKRSMLRSNTLFSDPSALLRQIEAA
jgi:putative protein-disulfide isomerase